jgi:hypothetical protein
MEESVFGEINLTMKNILVTIVLFPLRVARF